MYSCGPLFMDEQRQDVQLEPTYSSSVPIRDVTLRICRKQWTIGRCGERGSGISVLIAWHDDDDEQLFEQHYELSLSQYCYSVLTINFNCTFSSESERNNATGVRTRLLRCHSLVRLKRHHEDSVISFTFLGVVNKDYNIFSLL